MPAMDRNDTIFSQLLEYISKKDFLELVEKHDADKYVKSFDSWDQLVVMLYLQITQQTSLRNVEISFNSKFKYHDLLDTHSVHRSTLSDANCRCSVELYQDVFFKLIDKIHEHKRQKMEEVIRIIDSTPIQLKGFGYDWTESNYRIKGLKTHVVHDPQLKLPVHFTITAANVNDITEAKKLELKEGEVYICDKAYYDFSWWNNINQLGSYFVTRVKRDTRYKILRELTTEGDKVIKDLVITLDTKAGKAYKGKLRLLTVKRDNGKEIDIITNKLDAEAEYIAELYKMRWQIELLFKWIKQNLKIKKFVGRSENAVKIQIITAMIAYVLTWLISQKLKLLGYEISMKQLLIVIRDNLFQSLLSNLIRPPPDWITECVYELRIKRSRL